ncbi:F-box/WD repeat-containing protein 7 [Teleopsis dalmanni]|uniref:F-box/WD repeat-containing protein 7 n=1 Tax=Teleopsis dalmanni TaxID=139649 RepID=UPI0018CD4254|nr:F-box/WD repeat-containing protein 7 [Teleopsis dalmanni]
MEEKCLRTVDNSIILQHNTDSISENFLVGQDLLLHQPSTSYSSMSLLQDDDFANSQHDFAEVLDDETTTSGVSETFEISSSNSLPTCSDGTAPVAVDDCSSTDTIKLVQVSESVSSNNEFYNDAEIYVINDDDEDDETVGCISETNPSTSRIITSGSIDDSQPNGVIVAAGGKTIYLETPVVEGQQHPQILNLSEQLDFTEKAGKPKRLSDEFLLGENNETQMNTEEISEGKCVREKSVSNLDKFNISTAEIALKIQKSERCAESNVESQHERMSFRLKKMNINNNNTQNSNVKVVALEIIPSSSHDLSASTLADIESMDLIERQDFEREQRLTGGVILKSSSFGSNLIKSLIQEQKNEQQLHTDDDCPSSSSCSNGRAVSSDSKCTYKDLTTTPTSSRIHNSRLTKSTAKLNLCSTLSHSQQQQNQRIKTNVNAAKVLIQKPATSSSTATSTSSSSEIADSQSAPEKVSIAGTSASSDIFSNSNSNDSLMGGSTTTESNNCQESLQEEPKQPIASVLDNENSCSRTSALHSQIASASESNLAVFDDAQPSTSSARCHYAPHKNLRQVHASAQTVERYLSRSASNANLIGTVNAADSSSGSSVNLITGNRTRRRTDPSTISVFKMANETSADVVPIDNGDFSEDTWADCEENTSDLEEICTCHHSTSSSISSHGGSNTSLNETDELDNSVLCGKENDLSNYIQMVSLSEEATLHTPDCASASLNNNQQRKRKYNDSRLIDGDHNTAISSTGSCIGDANSRKRIAYDFTSTPRTSQNSVVVTTTPSSQLTLSIGGSPVGRRTPRSVIPTRDNPPPELQNWLTQFQRWSHAERLLAVDRLIEHCEPTQVRHMMKVIEPQFQRDFISLLPRELALQVLSYLEPKDLLRAAQTCRSWRFLCDDNLLWKEKCRKSQVLSETRTDRPKRGRAGNMPPIASPWKAAYMRQHIIEMNWRSRPIRDPKVLKGHDDHVITCLQFSGNRIVSGSDDNTLKVWSAVTGRCLRTLVGHTGGVWSSQMSGNTIISGSTDRTLKVWDMETGSCVHTLLGHTSTVRCMHLHGKKVVSGSRDATLRVWDIEQGSCLHLLVGHLAAVRCVQYDGKLIVSGAYDYMVKVWHPERQECLHTLQGHTNRVYSLQFDGIHVVSGSLDTSIRVWDVETGNCKHTLMGHQSLTSGMELRDNILVSGNADSTVKVWDITTGQCLQTLSGKYKREKF